MPNLHVVILAAGKGTRMKSALPKVLHRVAGSPMIDFVLRAAAALKPASTTVVLGHQAELVRPLVTANDGVKIVVQEPQLGTAHALLATEPVLQGTSGNVLLLSGDVPLLRAETLETLVEMHRRQAAAATIATAMVPEPKGYGRIVRSGEQIARIVEEKDATPAERAIQEINAGIYVFALDGLFAALRDVAAENAQREYYLPDLVSIYRQRGLAVHTMTIADPNEILGVNSRAEQASLSRILREQKNAELMAAGVTLDDPATTYVDADVLVGADTIIHPNVRLESGTVIGTGCEIHSGVRITRSTIGDRTTVLDSCVIVDAAVANDVAIGPFAHLRGGTTLADGAKVGNFVELKKTALGPGSKSMHLTYLGDAVIGARVNIGAGTITCNYDGTSKHTTTIEDGAFVGSDSQLIAPVTIGKDAYVGTGTTVRENVPDGSLAVSAGKQRNIEGWVEKRKGKA